MPQTSKKTAPKIALISTPWPLYSRPSIQLGTLKAYLHLHHPDEQVEVHHVYLKLAESIGYKLYHEISERTWLAESVYAALLFPEQFRQIEQLFRREAAGKPALTRKGLESLTAQVKKTTDDFVNSRNWGDYVLAGFSVSFCQLTSALYFIKCLKQKSPKLMVVIGGSTFSGSDARNFFKLFPEVDALVNGEGELPFSQLVGHLKQSYSPADLPVVNGIITSQAAGRDDKPTSFHQLEELNKLPPPDYDEYFDLLTSFDPHKTFFPILPVETSRGCWWQQTTVAGETTGCAFCNLNLQWKGYRSKAPNRVVDQIDHLTGKYKTLAVSLVDNVLPRQTSSEMFEKLITLKKDLRLFAEIRPTTPWRELKIMEAAGMQEVQIGIEALSTSLLRKLRKGTTAIRNLEIMKNCEALRIVNNSNLILHFPGSDDQQVSDTLQSIEFALPYRPLKAVSFWLGRGSPVWQNPEAYGITAIFNHPNWGCLFPRNIFQTMEFMIQAYRGDLGYQRKIWQPVRRKIRMWQKVYAGLHQGPSRSPILSLRDGRDFLIIRQRRLHDEPLNHRLVGTSRMIYLFCRRQRSIKRIRDQFPTFAEDKILAFLKIMVAKKLMFTENDIYLSLAVPVKPHGWSA